MSLYKKVIERAGGRCEVCKTPGPLEIHHIIFGAGKRKKYEREETLTALCINCHRGTHGVHGKYGEVLQKQLKEQLKDYYRERGHTESEIRVLIGDVVSFRY